MKTVAEAKVISFGLKLARAVLEHAEDDRRKVPEDVRIIAEDMTNYAEAHKVTPTYC